MIGDQTKRTSPDRYAAPAYSKPVLELLLSGCPDRQLEVTMMRIAVSLVVVLGCSLFIGNAVADDPGKCEGTNEWYQGKCRSPDEVKELKARKEKEKKGEAGTWTDPATKLTWQNPPAEEKMKWEEAKH